MALSCGPSSLGKTSMLGTTAALREAKQGSDEGPSRLLARQLQRPCWAAATRLRTTRLRLCLPQPADSLGTSTARTPALLHRRRAATIAFRARIRAPQRGTTPACGCPSPFNDSTQCHLRRSLRAPPARPSKNAHQPRRTSAQPARRLPAPRPPGRLTPAGQITGRRMSAAELRLGVARLSHESPISRNDALQQHDPEAHALRGPLSSLDSPPTARLRRRAPDTFPHATARRHCPATRPSATPCRRWRASRPLAPHCHDTTRVEALRGITWR